MAPITHKNWNWQQPDWPNFRYEARRLEQQESAFLNHGGILVGTIKHLNTADGDQLRIELMSNEAVQTSAIEGEIIDRDIHWTRCLHVADNRKMSEVFGIQSLHHSLQVFLYPAGYSPCTSLNFSMNFSPLVPPSCQSP